jgi:DHA1 family bicyclomycin/chloramphenicol resistance-like MFS transporter
VSSATVDLPIRGGWLIALLTALAALGQFASSAYLPSMPAMEAGLGASASAVQLTMTAYLAAFAVMQLVYGPIADRFGRRPVMLWGGVLFIAGSVLCMVAPTIEMVILGRAVQAVGACAGVVASRAVTRDLFEGPELTRVTAAIAMAFSLVPAIAPLIGGGLQMLAGWHGNFAAAALFGIAVFIPVVLYLRETNQSKLERLAFGTVWAGYRTVAAHPQFRAYALTTSAVMGGLFAFLTGAPSVLVGDGPGQISPIEFGIYPALSIPGFIISGIIVRKTVAKSGDAPLMKRGALFACLGGVLMLASALSGHAGVTTILVSMIVFVIGMGFVFSVGHAGALRHFKERAGTASALMGVLQLGTAALFSAAVAALASLGVLSFAIAMTVAGVASVAFSRGCR